MTILYNTTENGTIEFRSERKAWGVDIPAYVYDLWLPVLGAETVGVLGVYYRLEREGQVKGITLQKLARKCRIGTDKLEAINVKLAACGFIRVEKPMGWQKLAHYTTAITTLDPPMAVSTELVDQYGLSDYEPLCPWLVGDRTDAPKNPDRFFEKPSQVDDKNLSGYAKFDPSLLNPQENRDAEASRAIDRSKEHREGEDTPSVDQDRAPTSALESWIVTTLRDAGQRTLKGFTASERRKLENPIEGMFVLDEETPRDFPSPVEMWKTDPIYQAWAKKRILAKISEAKKQDWSHLPSKAVITSLLRDMNRFFIDCLQQIRQAEEASKPRPVVFREEE